MEINLLHVTGPSHASLPVPDSYAVPQLPQAKATPTDITLPLIDLSRSRGELRRAILDAGKEFGFFQVSSGRNMHAYIYMYSSSNK
jgi:2'-deoxymugineic-acid 2'-dioxygenase/mugineic-acid 3-dioxygenase